MRFCDGRQSLPGTTRAQWQRVPLPLILAETRTLGGSRPDPRSPPFGLRAVCSITASTLPKSPGADPIASKQRACPLLRIEGRVGPRALSSLELLEREGEVLVLVQLSEHPDEIVGRQTRPRNPPPHLLHQDQPFTVLPNLEIMQQGAGL